MESGNESQRGTSPLPQAGQVTRRDFIGMAALGAAAGQESLNVLVLLCDQLNASVLRLYGGPVATPHLEQLAQGGVVFTGATCPTPLCSPSRASLITGRWPHAHGIVYNLMREDYPSVGGPESEEGIRREDVTLDSVLAGSGYSTHQYGKWHLHGDALPYLPDQYGEHLEYEREMAGVFRKIREMPRETWMDWYGWALPVSVNPAYRRSVQTLKLGAKSRLLEFVEKIGCLELPLSQSFDVRVADKTVGRLRSLGPEPFAITCSFNTPHDPNVVPSPYYEQFDPARIVLPSNFGHRELRFEEDWSRQMVAAPDQERVREFLRVYYGCVRLLDDQVGRVMEALEASGRAGNTIVVFTADHGDMAGGHGMTWKSTSAFYDEIVRVPLIVSCPHIQPGKTDASASLTDLAPTLLDLTGHAVPASMQGVSLASLLRGKRGSSEFVYTFSERVKANAAKIRRIAPGTSASVAVRGGGWKYSRYPDGDEYLYHLAKDSSETKNLAAERAFAAQKRELQRQLRLWLERTRYPGGAQAVVPS